MMDNKKLSKQSYTPLLVIEEAARCLLCHDAPCSKACPANTNPARFIRAVRFRNFKGAVEIVRENNALAAVCARVCPTDKLCKKACSRCGIDKAIEIDRIQEYITDYEEKTGMNVLKVEGNSTGNISIVGSGPSGLEAAAVLAKEGYTVTVYEKRDKLGGWLSYGIPEFRLPQKIVESEIDKIRSLGVIFKTGIEIGKDITIEELSQKSDAVLLAPGMSFGRDLAIFEDSPYTTLAVDFLAQNKQGKININAQEVCVVVGGGDVAMDVSTSLKEMGVERVFTIARETWDEFLASKEELELARSLGVTIIDGYTPVKVEGKKVYFDHMKIEGSTLIIEADRIILAIGQQVKIKEKNLELDKGFIKTDDFKTSIPKVFATGDAIKGDKLVVNAVKLGHDAADAIHRFLGGKCDV